MQFVDRDGDDFLRHALKKHAKQGGPSCLRGTRGLAGESRAPQQQAGRWMFASRFTDQAFGQSHRELCTGRGHVVHDEFVGFTRTPRGVSLGR